MPFATGFGHEKIKDLRIELQVNGARRFRCLDACPGPKLRAEAFALGRVLVKKSLPLACISLSCLSDAFLIIGSLIATFFPCGYQPYAVPLCQPLLALRRSSAGVPGNANPQPAPVSRLDTTGRPADSHAMMVPHEAQASRMKRECDRDDPNRGPIRSCPRNCER